MIHLKKLSQIIGIGLSFCSLTACGSLFTLKSDAPIDWTHYVSKARLEAQKFSEQTPQIRHGMGLYSSCDAISSELNASLQIKWLEEKADISDFIVTRMIANPDTKHDQIAGSVVNSMPSKASPESMTNVQELGVDEADSYRVGTEQIYSMSFGQLQVIDRKSLELQGTLDLRTWHKPLLLTRGNKLIIVGQILASSEENQTKSSQTASAIVADSQSMPHPQARSNIVNIAIYQTTQGQMPVLINQSKMEGQYVDSRLLEDQLLVVMRDQIKTKQVPVRIEDFAEESWYSVDRAREIFNTYYANATRSSEIVAADQSLQGIACANIVKRKVSDLDLSLAKIQSFDIQNSQLPAQSLGVIGQGDQIYVSQSSLYLIKTQVQWFQNSAGSIDWMRAAEQKVLIQQIDLDSSNGALLPVAEGEVRGYIKDQWALHSKNHRKNLVITTSTWAQREQNNLIPAQNHLFILEQDTASKTLKTISSIENFGTNENIRAIRYLDNTVYVVTFRNTDPLYAFDISNLNAPKILGELKIPGFSTYMHPLAPGRLLGVGFDAFETGAVQGIQVSLFDTSNPQAMGRIDNRTYGSSGSSSDINFDHHAFFYDHASSLIGIPLIELKQEYPYFQSTVQFSGAQLLTLQGDRLIEKARLTHKEWIPSHCQEQMRYHRWSGGLPSYDINRLYRVDNRLITLSPFGLKAYNLDDLERSIKNLQYDIDANACQQSYGMPVF